MHKNLNHPPSKKNPSIKSISLDILHSFPTILTMQVKIPSDFFYNEAKNEYWNVSARLVAELIQNSYDAGAKNIHLNFDDQGYSCEDDGSGMTEEVLVDAMLTLGGSKKEGGATGGFGAAKKLILFAHEEYEIETNNIKVSGSVLNYDLSYGEKRIGTKISCLFSGEFENIESEARQFLSKCALSANVYVNGELFIDYLQLSPKKIDLGEMDVKDESSYYANILHNGLFMFQRYLGFKSKKSVIINTFGPSKELFSQSRDQMKGEWAKKLDELVKELTQDGISFGKEKPRRTIIKGESQFFSCINKALAKLSGIEKEVFRTRLNKILGQDWVDLMQGRGAMVNSEVKAAAFELAQEVVSLPVDFHMEGAYKDKYHPVTGQKKYRKLLTLYRVMIEDLARVYGMSVKYALGFCDDALGKYGNNIFYINPSIADMKGRDKYHKVLSIALHEFTHCLGHMSHDEDFAAALTDVIYRAKDMRGMVELDKEAKELVG